VVVRTDTTAERDAGLRGEDVMLSVQCWFRDRRTGSLSRIMVFKVEKLPKTNNSTTV
jgi:hypothetical protein